MLTNLGRTVEHLLPRLVALPRVRNFEGLATLPRDVCEAQHSTLPGIMIKAPLFVAAETSCWMTSKKMRQFKWYLQRLGAMSPAEIPWRAWRIGRSRLEAVRKWPTASTIQIDKIWQGPCTADELRLHEVAFPQLPGPAVLAAWPPDWRERCLEEAENILAHRAGFFMLGGVPLGAEIDWHRDYSSGLSTPVTYALLLDHRNARHVGDVKVIWELSRMQHLTRLAQAWRWTGDTRYPCEIVAQIKAWIKSNPWMMGINWTSPMECSLRLVTWTLAFYLIRDWDGLSDRFCRTLVASIYQHLYTIDRTYSLHSSANNHLIAEASGVYVATTYWCHLKNSKAWRQRARRHLLRECLQQNSSDGVNSEHAFPYQFFVWDLLLLAALCGRRGSDGFPAEYWVRLERMVDFMAWVTDANNNTPNVGDQDDGLAFNLGGDSTKPAESMLAVAARLFPGTTSSAWAGSRPEERASWLLGEKAFVHSNSSDRGSRSFLEGGYHIIRRGEQVEREFLLVFDVAPNGDRVTGAHGHADALSVVVNLGGEPFLSDPGTYSYQDTPQRRFFRSTAQHNTLCFGDDDQSEYLNRFMWGKRATVSLLEAALGNGGGTVAGRVDWWTGASHERHLQCDLATQSLTMRDIWVGNRPPTLNFVIAPGIDVGKLDANSCSLNGRYATLLIACDHGHLAVREMNFSQRCYSMESTHRLVFHLTGNRGSAVTRLTWQWRY